jgi:hypothetical protein
VSDGWSFGGSILTFAFPMLLFIVVAVALYILYTKPTVVPGHRTSPVERPVSHTAIPGIPAADQVEDNLLGRAPVDPAADDAAKTADGENAESEARE